MKKLMTAAALVAALASFQANAETLDFSYKFSPEFNGEGHALTGSLTGNLVGDIVENIANIHVFLDGVALSNQPLFAAAWDPTAASPDLGRDAVISTDASKNNFVFGNALDYDGLSAFFLFVNDQSQGQQVFATNIQTGQSLFDTPANGTWSLHAVAPVPLPAAGFLLMSGLGAIGSFARRRRQNTANTVVAA
jgi:hypothetical protein